MALLLEVGGVGKTYRDGTVALRRVSLSAEAGLFGLLGPNGAGKTTLMRILATLLRADRGAVRFGGVDVAADPVEIRRRLGYLPQELGFPPGATCGGMLDELARLKGFDDPRQRRLEAESTLERVGLSAHRRRRLETFSGGMKRRFGIAQALLGGPELLIVDEPTAGLDPEERNRFHLLLAELAGEAVVVLSTHIVEDVGALCGRMAILREGAIVADGPPAELRLRLDGQVWEGRAGWSELEEVRRRYPVLSVRPAADGGVRVRILSSERPGGAFDPAVPTVED
ncbi:MAG: ATP-binding cassette domain-containing protein, partial [Thermoanaerobaculia bacterium]|nr:ATP-binding cassette domain-containing protein [Thermoanaerobaculia bacterium]